MNKASSPSTTVTNRHKRIGGYLIDAGLLTPGQVDVALNDQKMTGMRFGEILAARGWVKQQTIEYLMAKVILPERQAETRSQSFKKATTAGRSTDSGRATSGAKETKPGQKTTDRRDVPISKPLPSVNSVDDDVSWVG